MYSRVGSEEATGRIACANRFRSGQPRAAQVFALAGELHRFPAASVAARRRLRDFRKPLHHLVPVENAAMAERTIIQWDKDDLETMNLLKVDCLALGMLTCCASASTCCNAHRETTNCAGSRSNPRTTTSRPTR